MCIAPATWPQMTRESVMFLRYRAANGVELAVAAERSTMQRWRLEIVPELVACEAAAGATMCRPE